MKKSPGKPLALVLTPEQILRSEMMAFVKPVFSTEAIVSDWVENSLVRAVLFEIEKNIKIRELKHA